MLVMYYACLLSRRRGNAGCREVHTVFYDHLRFNVLYIVIEMILNELQ